MPDPVTTAATAWAWDKYGKSLADKAVGVFKGYWDRFRWEDAAEKYRAKVKKLYGTMQIMGMAEPVPLDDIFAEVYMLDKPNAFRRFDIERLKQLSAADPAAPPHAKRINGLRLVAEKEFVWVEGKYLWVIPGYDEQDRNLFILGKPGAGKTTFLKYVALKAAEHLIDKVPIFISLKPWADSGKELMPFVAERFNICNFPDAQPFVEELLKAGGALVLFDGLDEVTQESGQRDRQTREINNFIEKYDQTQCLITCRIAASDYSFEGFTYVEIADFTERQIETFAANWFRTQEGERDVEVCNRFLSEFKRDENKGLRDLARTPLLLTLLCLAFNETLTFPQRRVEIYEEALDAMLKKWDASRRVRRDEVYRNLSLGHKENMLARIAAETFSKNEYFIPQAKLERLITDYVKNVPPHDTNEETDGEAILKAMEAQHGIFVERAHGIYSFSHLTFQEYFTAKDIIANADKGALANLVIEYCADKRWREVVLLTASLLPDASQFMKILRLGINDLVKDDEKLAALLTWAGTKTAPIPLNPRLLRPYYLYVELYYTSQTRALGGALASDLNRVRTFDLDLDIDRALDLDLCLARALACARDPDLDLSRARARARELGLNDLERGLAALSFHEDGEEFPHRLRTLMIKHRDIGRAWNLAEMQEVTLADYFNAMGLLEECLKVATMPLDEKKEMLHGLYLPLARLDRTGA
jgi:NACHT domain/NACHT C-terminal Helical domain 2